MTEDFAASYAGRLLRADFALDALFAAPVHDRLTGGISITLAAPQPSLRDYEDWLHSWVDGAGNVALQVRAEATAARRYLLRVPGQCDFWLDPSAGTVVIEPLSQLDPHTLEHLLLDQALPRLLTQQGQLVVHASAVPIGGATALFVGRSGWGKSTLAGLLQQRGHIALSDDCAVLEVRDNVVCAVPTYPSLRLFEDSIGHAFEEAPETRPVAGYSRKQRVQLNPKNSGTEHQPVRALYLLVNPNTAPDVPEIARASAAEACMALVEHNFRLDITARDQSGSILRQAAAVARLVPAFTLKYRHNFDQCEALAALVETHFHNEATNSGTVN